MTGAREESQFSQVSQFIGANGVRIEVVASNPEGSRSRARMERRQRRRSERLVRRSSQPLQSPPLPRPSANDSPLTLTHRIVSSGPNRGMVIPVSNSNPAVREQLWLSQEDAGLFQLRSHPGHRPHQALSSRARGAGIEAEAPPSYEEAIRM